MAEATPTADVEERGVAFPLVDGQRSTSATGRGVFADAARPADPALAAQIEAERDWRGGYLPLVRRLVEAGARSAADASAIAHAGLDSLYERFTFVREGEAGPLADALASPPQPHLTFDTVEVNGHGEPHRELVVPYRGERLRGADLHRQLEVWEAAGTVEPSFCAAIRAVDAHPEWLDLSDLTVAVIGAGAEMGPLFSLSRWGATVLPVDLPRPDLWQRVIAAVREGSGRALIPVREKVAADADDDAVAAVAGANVILELPEIATWLSSHDGPMTVGNYVYADGAIFVRAALAVDALSAHLTATGVADSIAVLATPTDVFAVPDEAVAMSAQRREGTRARSVVRAATRGRLFAPNYEDHVESAEGVRFGIADSLVAQQGPNYALAKRLQRWRATVAREAGVTSSVNVAPPTRTRSVLKNRVLAAAYTGARRFGVEVFEPSTSNTLMAAMLVHDLRDPSSVANPATPLRHPEELVSTGANHGGLWRNPFAARSVLGMAVVFGLVQRRT